MRAKPGNNRFVPGCVLQTRLIVAAEPMAARDVQQLSAALRDLTERDPCGKHRLRLIAKAHIPAFAVHPHPETNFQMERLKAEELRAAERGLKRVNDRRGANERAPLGDGPVGIGKAVERNA